MTEQRPPFPRRKPPSPPVAVAPLPESVPPPRVLPSVAPPPATVPPTMALPPVAPTPSVEPLPPRVAPPPAATISATATPPPGFGLRPSHAVLPSLAHALAQRVRFAAGEVPLWRLVTPLVMLLALGTAFAVAAFTLSENGSTTAAQKLGEDTSAPPATAASAPTAASSSPRAKLADGAVASDTSVKGASELSISEVIARSLAQSGERREAVQALVKRLEHDPGLIKSGKVRTELRQFCDDPETARDAVFVIARLPGPLSADLLYELWQTQASPSAMSELELALLRTRDVRAKTSSALAVALDLYDAPTCERSLGLLPRVTATGDRRAGYLLAKLSRRYGCGPEKRSDCFPCLRGTGALDAAMSAVKARPAPQPFSG